MLHEPRRATSCCFCGGARLVRTHAAVFHPFKKDHGPFEFHRCADCGSGLTLEPPSREQLSRLYGSFVDGYAGELREMMAGDPQLAMYRLQVRRILRHARSAGGEPRAWIDVGAGHGEISRLLAEALPAAKGTAVDLHDCPATLAGCERVDWRRVDVNRDDFADAVGARTDLVVSSAVWEHVLHPDRFAANLLRLLAPGGVLYLMTPDYGSVARRVFGRRWPYFEPGEHLNMPTLGGAKACLLRQWRALHGKGSLPRVRSAPLFLPYTVRYICRRFGLNAFGALFPAGWAVPVPAGILEAVLFAPSRDEPHADARHNSRPDAPR